MTDPKARPSIEAAGRNAPAKDADTGGRVPQALRDAVAGTVGPWLEREGRRIGREAADAARK